MSQASTLFSLFLQLSMALGVVLSALLLQLAMRVQGHWNALQLSDFHWTFEGIVVIGLLALIDRRRCR